MTFANPPYGAEIVYRLAANAPGTVRLVVSNAAGDTLANLMGPGGAGVHSVNWNFQSAVRRTRAELSPSQKRDSILLHVRAPAVLDSLARAGYDTAAIRTVRTQVAQIVNPNPNAGGGRGGRGGRGGQGGQACEHPTTQWERFCARPAEEPVEGGRGSLQPDTATAAAAAPAARRGRGGATGEAALNPVERIWTLIGMPAPAPAGGRGGRGGFFGAAGTTTANTGDYLVTLVVNGQTYRQTFRVERVSGNDDGPAFGGDDEHDQLGRYTPKATKATKAKSRSRE
jgi:hypothetical protein